jgi:hypothetical protein
VIGEKNKNINKSKILHRTSQISNKKSTMKNDPENPIDPEDELRAENEVIKLKLELEHGMLGMGGTPSLEPGIENQWLNHIYNFEQQYKNAKKIRVYDRIGRPAFIKANELTDEQISIELERIISTMGEKGIALDVLAEYDEDVIYKFITEELFEQEIDDMAIEGMVTHFTYEEFHPNHDYDLRNRTEEFVFKLIGNKWSEEFDIIMLADRIFFKDKEYDQAGISAIIKFFQDAHRHLRVEKFEIGSVKFDLETNKAIVQARIQYTAQQPDGPVMYEGACELNFILQWDYWSISRFLLPGWG